MKVIINGELKECVSEEPVPLLQWSHVVGTFDKDVGINVYVNGERAAELSVKGVVTPAKGYDLLIGKGSKKMSPVRSERGPSESILSHMVFDGLIDEVKIYSRCLCAGEVEEAYSAAKPKVKQPLQWRQMPSGPKNVANRFGAAYCRLRYAEEWEEFWRVGDHPDILIHFDESPARMLFWRGTAYGAVWVSEDGRRFMGDQSVEASGNSTGMGCAEHMSDKQCRYAYVRLLENHDARVVVHWRYAISDIIYGISRIEKDGWGEWADEYYYIYPDAVSTRKQILHSGTLNHEWQETIVLHQPGTRPEDNIEIEALTWGNMDGESRTYSWEIRHERGSGGPKDSTIQVVNLKSKYKPFIIYEPGSRMKLFGCCVEEQWSNFPWWNHWPVSQIANDGRRTGVPDRPGHSSLAQAIEDSKGIKHDKEKGTYTAVSLTGMSDKGVRGLVPLARSWNHPPELKIVGGDFASEGYDKYQRAYVVRRKDAGKPSTLKFELAASSKSPIVNPAFVVQGWGEAGAKLEVNGREVKRGRDFRFGHNHRLEGSDLVVWVQKESANPKTITISPSSK
jgi:hypothetical protein